jgi:serine/alanine adding enzyme
MDKTAIDIEVKLLTNEEVRWDQYVQNSSEASLYHLTGWKRVIEQTFGHPTYYVYAWQRDRIVGILPLVFLKSLFFGKFFVSLPFFNYGGIVADTDEIRQCLLEKAIHIAKQAGVDHIELRHTANYELNLPTKTSKVLMLLDLPATAEELWNSFKSKLRSQIRRPEKEGFTVKFGQLDEVESFYEVFVHNMRDLGTPVYTKRLFENILHEFPDNTRICTVYDNGKPIASGFIIGFKHVLQIPWASSLRTYNRFGPNMLLYWNILKFACEQGYTQFDFGRSTPNEGTYKFKQQWGTRPVQCYWQYWLSAGDKLPELNPHNPRYQFAIRIWQRLPLSLTKWLGPKIVKFIP